MQIKTDHLGIIVPQGTKLKPIRVKCTIKDKRTHRMLALKNALQQQKWSKVLDSDDVNEAANILHTTINSLLDSCLPTRTVKMSTRDPIWLTPLVKSLLQRKYKLVARGKNDQAEEVSKRIAEIIAQNRRNMDSGTFGSGSWWNKIDKLLLGKDTPRVLLKRNFVEDLNDYFADVCHDPEYEEPLKMDTSTAFETPQLDYDQVYNALGSIKRTATGSDKIPSWIWKDFANILSPVVMKVWNMSLATSMWPRLWKIANINPIPKVDIPKMVPGHFAERHFAERHFAERTFCRRSFCRTDVLPNGHFSKRTFCRTDSLPKGQLAENKDVISSKCLGL
ncbi:Hypothetical predicted protein [Paramuricea clavata]|uniref:Uncharacterized protein n=1 Tax=Paramuricea clavata TaxID=317549 RepID=A0A6S7GDQ6_PARCT|nr:Hypothetical predicted protein [Paramuricea clavata]